MNTNKPLRELTDDQLAACRVDNHSAQIDTIYGYLREQFNLPYDLESDMVTLVRMHNEIVEEMKWRRERKSPPALEPKSEEG